MDASLRSWIKSSVHLLFNTLLVLRPCELVGSKRDELDCSLLCSIYSVYFNNYLYKKYVCNILRGENESSYCGEGACKSFGDYRGMESDFFGSLTAVINKCYWIVHSIVICRLTQTLS